MKADKINQIRTSVKKNLKARTPKSEVKRFVVEDMVTLLNERRQERAAYLKDQERLVTALGDSCKMVATDIDLDKIKKTELRLAAMGKQKLEQMANAATDYTEMLCITSELRKRGEGKLSEKFEGKLNAIEQSWIKEPLFQECLQNMLAAQAAEFAAPGLLPVAEMNQITSHASKTGLIKFANVYDYCLAACDYDADMAKDVSAEVIAQASRNPMPVALQQRFAELQGLCVTPTASYQQSIVGMDAKALAAYEKRAEATGVYTPDVAENTFEPAGE